MIVSLEKNNIKFFFAYDPRIVNYVRALAGRVFLGKTQGWSVPAKSISDEVISSLKSFGFVITDEATKLINDGRIRDEQLAKLASAGNAEFATKLPLYPYQRAIVSYMVESGGCLNACFVGSGKTLMTIATLEQLSRRSEIMSRSDELSRRSEIMSRSGLPKGVLVIAPKSVLYQWRDEVAKWAPQLRTVVVTGNHDERTNLYASINSVDIVIMGYETMRIDSGLYPMKWETIILDEAHRIGNTATKLYQKLNQLQATHRYALTATPIMNRILDVYGIFNWVSPGFLGTYTNFLNNYVIKDQFNAIVGSRNVTVLKKRLSHLMISKQLSEVAIELPPLTEEDIKFDLSVKERALYKKFQEELLWEIDNGDISKMGSAIQLQATLVKLLRLQELVDSLELLGNSKESTKLDTLKDHLSDIMSNGNKVIVFSRFTRMCSILKRELAVYNPVTITGQDSALEREEHIKEFNTNPQCKLLICSEAGGLGLNLQSATVIYNYDLPMSTGKYVQRVGRSHRLGQDKPVFVYNLLARKTIDERMKKMLGKKRSLAEKFITMSEVKDLLLEQI